MMTLSRWKVLMVLAVSLLGIFFALPNVLPAQTRAALPPVLQRTLNLGLDLQGGSYLLLEVDLQALRAEQVVNLVEDVRTTLRNENIEFSGLGQADGAVSVRITD